MSIAFYYIVSRYPTGGIRKNRDIFDMGKQGLLAPTQQRRPNCHTTIRRTFLARTRRRATRAPSYGRWRAGKGFLHRSQPVAARDALTRLRHLHHIVLVPQVELVRRREPARRREQQVESLAHCRRIVRVDGSTEQRQHITHLWKSDLPVRLLPSCDQNDLSVDEEDLSYTAFTVGV